MLNNDNVLPGDLGGLASLPVASAHLADSLVVRSVLLVEVQTYEGAVHVPAGIRSAGVFHRFYSYID